MPFTAAATWGVGLDRFYTEIVGLNPVWGMDDCPRLSVL